MKNYKNTSVSAKCGSLLVGMCLAVLAAAASPALAQVFDRQVFDTDLASLTKNAHRLPGREDGSRQASRYVEQRLMDIGLDEVYVQEFPVVLPRTTQSEIVVDGSRYPMHALMPNLLQASVTPSEGLSGKSLYAGKGTPREYGDERPEGRIVFIDYDCDKERIHAFAFGAKAVVFIGRENLVTNPYHSLNIPANLPRFYICENLAEELGVKEEPRDVTLFAASTWEQLEGRNVIGVIRGSDPQGSDGLNHAVLLAAPLDSYSEIPELSPGARDAANAAVLLQTAEYLMENRPKRDVVIAFFDAQSQSHGGAKAFYGSLFRRYRARRVARYTLEDRFSMLQSEKSDLEKISEVLMNEEFPRGPRAHSHYASAVRTLVARIRGISDRPMGKLKELRLAESDLRHLLHELDADSPRAIEIRRELEEMRSPEPAVLGLIEELEIEDLAWNTLLRLMNEDQYLEDESIIAEHGKRLIVDPNPAKQELKRQRFMETVIAAFEEALQGSIAVCLNRIEEIEVQLKQVEQGMAIRDAVGPADSKLVLHVHVNLGDAGDMWSFVHGEYTVRNISGDPEGFYGSIYRAMREVNGDLQMPGFDERPVSALYSSRMFVPSPFADSCAVARMFGRFNVSAMTVLDALSRQGLPADTLENLNVENIVRQGGEFAEFMHALAAHDGLDRDHPTDVGRVRYVESEWSRGIVTGNVVRQADSGDPMRSAAVSGAVVAIVDAESANMSGGANSNPANQQILRLGWEGIPRGFNPTRLVMSGSNGMFEYGPTLAEPDHIFIADFDSSLVPDEHGLTTRGIIRSTSVPRVIAGRAFPIVRVKPLTVVAHGAHRGPVSTTAMRAASTASFRPDRYLQHEAGPVMVLFAPYDAGGTKLFNRNGVVILNNANTREEYQGTGVTLDNPFERYVATRYTANDLWTLNEYRLAQLRANQIGQESLEELQGKSADILADAYASDVQTTSRYFGMLEASSALSRRIYNPLVGVMKDLVTAVVLLLLLAIPFAFALERLLIGTPHIYRQIGWFAVMFLATFSILYVVNPAFKLAATPIIIFLAFTIILLSSLVIFIMFRKLEVEMQKLKGLSASAHSADVSRVSTMMAAVKMGISTMRRRPIRTILTAITVTLLTFTILTFASFGSSWGNLRTYRGTMNPPHRVMVRYPFWTPIPANQVVSLAGYLEDRAEVVPRYWVAPLASDVQEAENNGVSLDVFVATADARNISRVSAALGLYPVDLEQQENLRDLSFEPGSRIDLLDSDGIFLTGAVADQLGLTDEDIGVTPVLFNGMKMTFAGFTADALSNQRMVDGSSILPVDYAASASGEDTAMQGDDVAVESDAMQFITYSLDSLVIIGGDTAKRLGGEVRAVVIYAHDHSDLEEIADEVAMITGIPTYLGSRGGVYRLFFSTLVEASGVRDLFIPVILGGLIIFATMLGSVSDREREIYTFSSLGLGPAHVAGLFFAEASIYAVVGGMGGYLLGQVVAKGMGVAAQYGWLAMPSMNFSSTNAVVTIFIVMSTVLLSTIYPAIKASKSANPGIQRNWKIGDPVGDVYDLVFPFTVSAYDLTGVVGFLEEHFNNYKDAAVGVFTTLECEPIRQAENDMLGLRAQVALAPFDLGIEQTFIMLSKPSDVEGINEVRIIMKRESGAYNDWRRANRVFVNDIRKQFLIWRSIDTEVTEKYRETNLSRWNDIRVIGQDDLVEGEASLERPELVG